ncbi:hemolymph lipopolysaccharide-binding protein-like [Diprion similis]|uniref:hemolymph lipopolysaccharide-binding protein-like n=1 Tax=Diprion similis TaxID=362088 RepID=UPI001EF846B9|nr:hemolymph lipopolysaccharide-binding protein-like [Diprion similis]
MAIISVVLRMSLCITLTMAQQPASTNSSVVWLYRPTFIYNLGSRCTSPLHHARRNQSTAVRDDYTYTPGIGAHKVHTDAANWYDAWLRCRLEGSNLSIINSEAEKNLIVELLSRAGPSHNGNLEGRAYMGFHSFFYPKVWITLEGQTLSQAGFNEWHDGEPSGGDNERCGSIFTSDGKLNDQECGRTTSFVCERHCC